MSTGQREIQIPPPIDGFELVHRSWDKNQGKVMAKILPGEFYVTRQDEVLSTILGSCVAACIRDRVLGIGGINHFMLPVSKEEQASLCRYGEATRYGNFAMEQLINEIIKNGGKKNNLEIKVFGGSRILSCMTDIGNANCQFVKKFLDCEGYGVTSMDLGGNQPRRIHYYPSTGKVRVKKLAALKESQIVEQEESYLRNLKVKPVEGEVELF